ncbi:MAG TPA: hypothetical protein DCE44_20785 [Verrucomicrobiales bacterium]|nr:hypothetical protein [Verrucomicrobiales bacterium]
MQPVTRRRRVLKKLSFSLGALALAASTLLVTGFGQKHYRLGGAWVGGNPTYTWSNLFAPRDQAGRTAAARPILKYFNADFAGLLASFGADSLSDATGEIRMVSPDTGRWTLISYMQITPKHPGELLQVRAIIVSHGTWQFTDNDTAVLNYTLDVHLPTADTDGDGLPEPGAQPILSIPTVDNAKRIPIL